MAVWVWRGCRRRSAHAAGDGAGNFLRNHLADRGVSSYRIVEAEE
jgi:hypothetical protein